MRESDGKGEERIKIYGEIGFDTAEFPVYSYIGDCSLPKPENLRTDLIKREGENFQNKEGSFMTQQRAVQKKKIFIN